MAKEFTDSNFQEEVINSNVPVLVDFWAEWCGPCKTIGPIIDELATKFDGKISIGKVNVDENQDVPTQYGIRSIPTLIFFKDGEVVDKAVGLVPASELEERINNLL